jgi:hypothetical protein
MRTRTLVAFAVALVAGAAVAYAASDGFIGTWKLNEAKSKIASGTAKNSTVIYAAAGDSVRVTIDGTDANGKPMHAEWTGKYDGKDYPVTGDATTDMRSYRAVDDHTLIATSKKGGKLVNTARIVLSADGKTRTVTLTATDDKGMKTTSTAVYDKS